MSRVRLGLLLAMFASVGCTAADDSVGVDDSGQAATVIHQIPQAKDFVGGTIVTKELRLSDNNGARPDIGVDLYWGKTEETTADCRLVFPNPPARVVSVEVTTGSKFEIVSADSAESTHKSNGDGSTSTTQTYTFGLRDISDDAGESPPELILKCTGSVYHSGKVPPTAGDHAASAVAETMCHWAKGYFTKPYRGDLNSTFTPPPGACEKAP